MRVTIIGPGSVGLLWAARLAQAGAQVCLLDYKPERAALLQEKGISLEDSQGQAHLLVEATADPAQGLAHTELALLCVKAYQTAQVTPILSPTCRLQRGC